MARPRRRAPAPVEATVEEQAVQALRERTEVDAELARLGAHLAGAWCPPGSRVVGELPHDGVCKLAILTAAGERVAVMTATKHVDWSSVWLGLVCEAWSRHRLAVAAAEAIERETRSYAKAERVNILGRGRPGER